MFEKMKELIAEQLNCPAEEIKMESSFKEDLGADSLDLFELVMSLALIIPCPSYRWQQVQHHDKCQ